MARFVYSIASVPSLTSGVMSIQLGGTGATSAFEAAENLNAIPISDISVPGGVAPLDANAKLPLSLLKINVSNGLVQLDELGLVPMNLFKTNSPNGFLKLNESGQLPENYSADGVTVWGAVSLYRNQPGTYVITDYDSSRDYVVSAIVGTVIRTGDVITYTPGSYTGMAGFVVNGKTFTVQVIGDGVYTPVILTPSSNAVNLPESYTAYCSDFIVSTGTDSAIGGSWQLATDLAFKNIIQETVDDPLSLRSWQLSNLLNNTTYYLRVRQKGAVNGYSDWSAVVSFKTAAYYYPNSLIGRLNISDPAGNDWLGQGIAASKDGLTIAISGSAKADGGSNRGATYVFVKSGNTWSQEAKIVANDAADGDYFGQSIHLSEDGNTLIVGAYAKTNGVNVGQGAAYIYTRSAGVWTLKTKLLASDGATNDQFGVRVALSAAGNVAVIGAYAHTVTANQQGAVYVFALSGSTWTQQAKLLASDAAVGDIFGLRVAISSDGQYIVVGAQNKNGTYTQQGAAYVFTKSADGWVQRAKLVHSDAAVGDKFGSSVAISTDGSYVVIGASEKLHVYPQAGAVYVFTRSGLTWTQQAKLVPADPNPYDHFGTTIGLSYLGNRLVIGANQRTEQFVHQGVSYVFSRTADVWTQKTKLLPDVPAAEDYFGSKVEISGDGNVAMVGAYNKSGAAGVSQGAVFVFM